MSMKFMSQVKKTSSELDNTPHWPFKHCALELTAVITHIINLTLIQGKLPQLSKWAIINNSCPKDTTS